MTGAASLLENHGARYTCRVPDGLRELCSDISREVLRRQPTHIYTFIADYVERLLLTRESAKVAVNFVNKIIDDSESIVNLINRGGLNLGQVASVAPQLQKAFRDYLSEANSPAANVCIDDICNDQSEVSVIEIVEAAGIILEEAERAARIIQAAFRRHLSRNIGRETNDVAPWHQAIMNTIDILRDHGLSDAEAIKTAKSIESTYRDYYTRRNQMKSHDVGKNAVNAGKNGYPPANEGIQAVTSGMMYCDYGITVKQANQAATIIQHAFRKYRSRSDSRPRGSASTCTMAARPILDNLHQKVFDKVLSREAIPREFGTIQEIAKATEKLPNAYKERLDGSKLFLNSARSSEEEVVETTAVGDEDEHLHH